MKKIAEIIKGMASKVSIPKKAKLPIFCVGVGIIIVGVPGGLLTYALHQQALALAAQPAPTSTQHKTKVEKKTARNQVHSLHNTHRRRRHGK